ncbi:hypothetical protein [Maioricimonas sp. JC845]|uniref:hypothetical protein n=1 Tax=Maioricimonas sp. JC845 TaxID=3232138 RepID=UPI0034580779
MSIQLDVIPNSSASICWHQIISFAENVVRKSNSVPRNLRLRDLRSKEQVDELDSLACPGYYYCTSDDGSALTLTLEPTAGGEEDWDYLSDFGRTLVSTEVRELFDQWMSAGLLVSIASGGGRPPRELKTLMALAVALAQLTLGYVVVKDSTIHNVPVGVYRPDEILSLQENDAGLKG